jgi:hypothetical protein
MDAPAADLRFSRLCLTAAFTLTLVWGALYAGFAHSALCDEPGHVGVMIHFAEKKPGWPDHLTTPPGYHLVALALGGGQPSLTAARVTSTLVALLALTAFAGAWRALHARPAGPATLLFALLPIFQPFTGLAYNDVPALALLLCAIWAQLAGRLPTAALALALACLVRQTNLVWAPFLILWEILRTPAPPARPLWRHALAVTFTGTRGYVIVLAAAAAVILYAGRLTPGTANSNDFRPNPAAFTFAALLVVTLGLPVWLDHLRPALGCFATAVRRRPAFAALWLAGVVATVALLAFTYTNPHAWNRDLWWDGVRFTLLRNWPLIYIEKFPALRVVSGLAVVFAVLALAHLCRASQHRRPLALSLAFAAALLGSNYLVDPRYYLTSAAFLLLFIAPSRRAFFLLAGWWAFIALLHDPFILTGYSLW